MPIEETLCPDCGGPMVSRSSKFGVFWGCKAYPKCKGTRDADGMSKADRMKEKQEELAKQQEDDNDKFRFRKSE